MARLTASVSEISGSREARERMTELGRTLVDGLGAPRIVEAMQRSGAQ
jgi:hypothetical protein